MTAFRRVSHWVGIAAIALIGVLLILESSDVTGAGWRRDLSSGLEDVAFPSWGLWLSGLVGAGLAILGVTLVAAQLAPPKKGLNSLHEVYKSSDGNTQIRGRAAVRAVRHELEAIEGVVAVDARVVGKTMHVEIEIDDRANLTTVENDARSRLGHEFWISLGLADFAVNLLVTHHPQPPRVR